MVESEETADARYSLKDVVHCNKPGKTYYTLTDS